MRDASDNVDACVLRASLKVINVTLRAQDIGCI